MAGAGAESTYVSLLIRKITLAALMAALVGGTLVVPASASPVAHASKCKKKKKHKRSAQSAKKRKKKKCKRGSGSGSGATLPGQATHPNATPPTQTPTLTVDAVTVVDNPILGGNSTNGQVTIAGAAPSGGQAVSLQSTDPSRASVPGSVVVPGGQTSASFPVTTSAGVTVTETLTATIGGSSDSTQLKVVSSPSVDSVSLERHCVANSDSFAANRVTLDVPAPSDTNVTLSSDDSSLSVPPSVVVPAGSRSALFGASATTPTPDPKSVVVTATLGTSSATDTASVSSTTPSPTVSSVSLNPDSVGVHNSSIGTVTLACEAPGTTVVSLSSDNPTVADPSQPTVTLSAGERSATFQVDAFVDGTAQISASAPSTPAQQATLTVTSLAQ